MEKTLIKELPKEERPRERLIEYGANNLSNQDLLAIILKTGTKGTSVNELASSLLKKIKNIKNLKNTNIQELTKIKGIGKTKAIELIASIELGKRLFIKENNQITERFITSSDVFNKNKHLFYEKKQEYFYCLYLDSKKELIERKLLFMGTLNKSLVHPREVFKGAYLTSASSIICMHNHPSGDKTPSKDDIILTNSLMEIGRLQQIPIIDHIIFTDDDYYSFYEECKINEKII